RSYMSNRVFPSFWQAPLLGAVVLVVLGIDLPHRRLLRALFMRVRNQPGQTRYQKNRIAQLVREPQVGADRRDGAVDVDRQRTVEPLLVPFEGPFADADEPHVLSL